MSTVLETEDSCELLGPFALLVQALMGILALSSLVWKRSKEYPNRRPWKVWLFDVSKQVLGAFGIHMLNVFMSILGGQSDDWFVSPPSGSTISSETEQTIAQHGFNITNAYWSFMNNHKTSTVYFIGTGLPPDSKPRLPIDDGVDNPCDYYFLNILFDTTIGIPILWAVLYMVFNLARRAGIEGIVSGEYGSPPKYSYYSKQLGLYFVGLLSMKLIIYIMLIYCPFLVKFANWMLHWSDSSPNFQVGLVVFIFPLIMNTFQYYVIDNIIQSPEYHLANQKIKELDRNLSDGEISNQSSSNHFSEGGFEDLGDIMDYDTEAGIGSKNSSVVKATSAASSESDNESIHAVSRQQENIHKRPVN